MEFRDRKLCTLEGVVFNSCAIQSSLRPSSTQRRIFDACGFKATLLAPISPQLLRCSCFIVHMYHFLLPRARCVFCARCRTGPTHRGWRGGLGCRGYSRPPWPRCRSSCLSPVQERCGPRNGSEVDLHCVRDVAGVAAGHRHGDWDAASAAGLEHEAVALGEALLAHREAPEPVIHVRVGTCEVDREFCPRPFERLLEAIFECFEELPVVRAVGESDLEVALLFAKREVVCAVGRERKNPK